MQKLKNEFVMTAFQSAFDLRDGQQKQEQILLVLTS